MMTSREQESVELIELLFFAYRDFVSDPDEILRDYGFGRAPTAELAETLCGSLG